MYSSFLHFTGGAGFGGGNAGGFGDNSANTSTGFGGSGFGSGFFGGQQDSGFGTGFSFGDNSSQNSTGQCKLLDFNLANLVRR